MAMNLLEMKQMAYFQAAPGMPGPFCPGCYAPLHGDVAFEWHSACFLKIKLLERGPEALPASLRPQARPHRRQRPFVSPPKPAQHPTTSALSMTSAPPSASIPSTSTGASSPPQPIRRGFWRSSLAGGMAES